MLANSQIYYSEPSFNLNNPELLKGFQEVEAYLTEVTGIQPSKTDVLNYLFELFRENQEMEFNQSKPQKHFYAIIKAEGGNEVLVGYSLIKDDAEEIARLTGGQVYEFGTFKDLLLAIKLLFDKARNLISNAMNEQIELESKLETYAEKIARYKEQSRINLPT